ncbi:hypothetical protein [Motilibacter peucedani]|uniref:hypothetical protein n=1 Tax=Motilibacter peucedani TaxID=598650 RepID=UPI000EB3C4C4|nr:hypothetical protein [Motilibacter peucedani]
MTRLSRSPLAQRLARRSWIVLVCVVVAAAVAAALHSRETTSYSSSATLIVPSGNAAGAAPGAASEAQKLAVTYAAGLGEDDAVADAVAAATHRTRGYVDDHLVVSNVQDTSLVQMKYTGDSRAEVTAAGHAFVQAVSGSSPASKTVRPGTLSLIKELSVDSVAPSSSAIPLGIILGLVLGAALAVAADRADPRIYTTNDLSALLHCPATRVSPTAPGSVATLVPRWLGRSSSGVTLLPVLDADRPAAALLQGHLRAAGDLAASTSVASSSLEQRLVGDLTPTPGALVLVAREGDSLRAVSDALLATGSLETQPVWFLLVPRSVGRRRRAEEPARTPDLAPLAEGHR